MRETSERIYFWTAKDYFSNFYYSPFKHKGILFKWSEQAIMWRKAKYFGAEKIASDILKAQTPKECKELGRSRSIPFDNAKWDSYKEQLYKEVLLDKFSTDKLKQLMLSTNGKLLVEASPYDKIWGCGLAEWDSRIDDSPESWPGLNLLGEVLMEVRTELSD